MSKVVFPSSYPDISLFRYFYPDRILTQLSGYFVIRIGPVPINPDIFIRIGVFSDCLDISLSGSGPVPINPDIFIRIEFLSDCLDILLSGSGPVPINPDIFTRIGFFSNCLDILLSGSGRV
jgi:hypothetical protein